MLDLQYIQKVRTVFNKHYQTIISGKKIDRHHIHIYTASDTNDGILDYLPAQLSNRNDNDGYIEPVRPLIFRLSSSNNVHWDCIENDTYIHAIRFAKHQWLWNLNLRTDNAISLNGKKQLKHDMKRKFHVDVSPIGMLSVSNDNILQAFQQLIKAMQYLRQNGEKYTTTAEKLVNSAANSLKSKKEAVENDASIFKKAREQKYHRTSGSKHKSGTVNSTHTKPAALKNDIKNLRQLSKLSHKHVVLIGNLPHKKSYYIERLRGIGCKIQQRVNGKTDYVLCSKPSKSASYKEYKKNHLPNLLKYFTK